MLFRSVVRIHSAEASNCNPAAGACVPEPVTFISVTVSNETVAAYWNAPPPIIDRPLRGYYADLYQHPTQGADVLLEEKTICSGLCSAAARFINLVNGNTYYVAVRPFNDDGTGQAATSSASLMEASPTGDELLGGGNPSELNTTCGTSWGVTCATGNYSFVVDDISIPTRGSLLDFTRTYNSQPRSEERRVGKECRL